MTTFVVIAINLALLAAVIALAQWFGGSKEREKGAAQATKDVLKAREIERDIDAMSDDDIDRRMRELQRP